LIFELSECYHITVLRMIFALKLDTSAELHAIAKWYNYKLRENAGSQVFNFLAGPLR